MAIAGVGFVVGLNVGESGEARRLSKQRDDGMVIASYPPPRCEFRCGKQEIREYIHACKKRKDMEAVK